MLNIFYSFWLSLLIKWQQELSFTVKSSLSELALSLSVPTVKTQCFVHLSFNKILQSINGFLSILQKLLRYFNGSYNTIQLLHCYNCCNTIVAFSKVPFADAVLPINLALYLKDFKLLWFALFASNLVVSSLEQNYNLLVVAE